MTPRRDREAKLLDALCTAHSVIVEHTARAVLQELNPSVCETHLNDRATALAKKQDAQIRKAIDAAPILREELITAMTSAMGEAGWM